MQTQVSQAEDSRLGSPKRARLLEWDRACALSIHRGLAAPYEKIWIAVDHLGDGGAWIALMVVLLLFGGPNGPRCALHMFLVGVCALALYKIVKKWACRARPCVQIDGVRRCAEPLDEFSFPSGHVLHAVAFTTVAVAYFPALAIALLPLNALIFLSRVALGLHYPSDVVAGAAIGWAVAAGSFFFV